MSAMIPKAAPSHAQWHAYVAARAAFERAPAEATMAAVLDAWDAWSAAFLGANHPEIPRLRGAVTAGLAARLPAEAA